jgi:uncharacterized protein YqeY
MNLNLKTITKDVKFKVRSFRDGVQVRLTNRKINVVDTNDGNYIIECLFAAKNADQPAIKHENFRGPNGIRRSLIKLSDEAMEAIVLAYLGKKDIERRVEEMKRRDDDSLHQIAFLMPSNKHRVIFKEMNKFKLLEVSLTEARKDPDQAKLRDLLTTFKGEVELKLKPSTGDVPTTEDEKLEVLFSVAKSFKKNLLIMKDNAKSDLEKEDIDKELFVMERFLPVMMTKEEIINHLSKIGIESLPNIGAKMGKAQKELKGKADGSDIKDVVITHFNGK